ncbi:hypothetical protein EMIHUDRAFT_121063 [Emiliania huxleyi CCMP1516]|uniref:Uncharacterized protein n=2 Tax=Emiliania huxleyi TaxID=2903 RepID=A0A0D3I947_EMIH1|nr:hypothetical protein EMIHUDRAFT_121063 [Emiliania huxleyi CCMP1516]EOD07782.1 hypothetical protein EMIHUDRAFT_121063 [Emiliania huxleyi CCMP1516]|eukprot:XP_005760211.1 hypothetical protein EMIHUDRAFT_121063 [Emiliania huxleyi CCMP1516]
MAAVADRPCDLFASSPPLVPAPPPRAMLHDPYEGISLTVDAQEWHRLDVDRALMWTRVRVLSNQASFALRVRVRPPDGERLPDKLALKATLVVDRQGGKDTGAGKDAASAAAFTKPHLLVSEAGEAPLLLDAPPGRHSRAALLPAAPVMVVPDRSGGGGGTAHFSLRLGDYALSDRCGIGRSLLKLLITPEIATSADMEAICAGGGPRSCTTFTAPFRAITRLRLQPSIMHMYPPPGSKPSGKAVRMPPPCPSRRGYRPYLRAGAQ